MEGGKVQLRLPDLPPELLQCVVAYLDPPDVFALMRVSAYLLAVCDSDAVWARLTRRLAAARAAARRAYFSSVLAAAAPPPPPGPAAGVRFIDWRSAWVRSLVASDRSDGAAFAAVARRQRELGAFALARAPERGGNPSFRDPDAGAACDRIRASSVGSTHDCGECDHDGAPVRPPGRSWRWALRSLRERVFEPRRLTDVCTTMVRSQCVVGEFAAGVPVGPHVRFMAPHGEYYFGCVSAAQNRSGFGVYRRADGSVLAGVFADGQLAGATLELGTDGSMLLSRARSSRASYCLRVERDGGVYRGGMRGDLRSGFGIYAWPNGDLYHGFWRNGSFHGRGTYVWGDGRVYRGDWLAGRKHGRGRYDWPNGVRYVGMWYAGLRAGPGIVTVRDGASSSAYAVHALFVADVARPSAFFGPGGILCEPFAVPLDGYFLPATQEDPVVMALRREDFRRLRAVQRDIALQEALLIPHTMWQY